MFIFRPRCLKVPVKVHMTDFFFYLLDGIYTKSWYGNIWKSNNNIGYRCFFTAFQPSENGKFHFRLARNRVRWRPGASQAVTSKQERRSTYFSNLTNRKEKHKWNIPRIRYSSGNIYVRHPELLQISIGNPAHWWGKWKQKFEIFLKAIGASKKSEEKKVEMPLNHMGAGLLKFRLLTRAWRLCRMTRQTPGRKSRQLWWILSKNEILNWCSESNFGLILQESRRKPFIAGSWL